MKNKIPSLIAMTALLFSGVVLAAEETGSTPQPPAAPAATTPEPTTAAPAKETQPAVKHTPPPKAGAVRPKDLDLRHCLELETNAEIAKCAGE